MKILTLTLLVLPLGAQVVTGPAIGYVVDSNSRLHPILGVPSAAHIAETAGIEAKMADGEFVLLPNGEARMGTRPLGGKWTQLENGVFLSEDRRMVMTVDDAGTPWTVALPSAAKKVGGCASRIVAILENESLVSWAANGKQEFSLAASQWWSIDVASDGKIFAYDPAAKTLLQVQANGIADSLAALEGEVEISGLLHANGTVLMADYSNHKLHAWSANGFKTYEVPIEADSLSSLAGGQAVLLSRDPSRPVWIFDPAAAEPLLVIPALSERGSR